MAKFLCLESATTVCSVALFEDEELLASREIDEGFRHSEKLTVFVEEVLDEESISLRQIDAIAVSAGPGSYTGLRIGMSVAKGLCFANDKPLISVSTLELMASRGISEIDFTGEPLFCPMIDARRMEVYCALFDKHRKLLNPPAAVVIDEHFFEHVKGNIYFFGDGAAKCKDILSSNFIYAENIFPSAFNMGQIVNKKYKANDFENVSLVEPVYLKEFVPGRTK
jgi:tRNA threonylcarbamoyladenosine biosynthesis protein TsaB